MKPARCVFPDWMFSLTMQQQSVLMLALRGPDGAQKFHPCKDVVRAYRAMVLKAAYFGREMLWGEKADNFMTLDVIADRNQWQGCVKVYFDNVDSLPHHYHMHLLHGAQILGYKHPIREVRQVWNEFYLRACNDAHMNPETEAEMDSRLGDWNQENWDA